MSQILTLPTGIAIVALLFVAWIITRILWHVAMKRLADTWRDMYEGYVKEWDPNNYGYIPRNKLESLRNRMANYGHNYGYRVAPRIYGSVGGITTLLIELIISVEITLEFWYISVPLAGLCAFIFAGISAELIGCHKGEAYALNLYRELTKGI